MSGLLLDVTEDGPAAWGAKPVAAVEDGPMVWGAKQIADPEGGPAAWGAKPIAAVDDGPASAEKPQGNPYDQFDAAVSQKVPWYQRVGGGLVNGLTSSVNKILQGGMSLEKMGMETLYPLWRKMGIPEEALNAAQKSNAEAVKGWDDATKSEHINTGPDENFGDKVLNFIGAAPAFEAGVPAIALQTGQDFKDRAIANGVTDPTKQNVEFLKGVALGVPLAFGLNRIGNRLTGKEADGIVSRIAPQLADKAATSKAGRVAMGAANSTAEVAPLVASTQILNDLNAHAMGYADAPDMEGADYWKGLATETGPAALGSALLGGVHPLFAHAAPTEKTSFADLKFGEEQAQPETANPYDQFDAPTANTSKTSNSSAAPDQQPAPVAQRPGGEFVDQQVAAGKSMDEFYRQQREQQQAQPPAEEAGASQTADIPKPELGNEGNIYDQFDAPTSQASPVETRSPEEIAAENEYRAQLDAELGSGDLGTGTSGTELLDAVREAGGLPSPSHPEFGQSGYSGELRSLMESSRGATDGGLAGQFFGDMFRKDAPKLDELTQHLQDAGFPVETPADTLDLIDQRLRTGQPVYGWEAGGGEATFLPPEVEAQGIQLRHRFANEAGGIPLSLFEDAVNFGKAVFQKGMDFASWSKQMLLRLGAKVMDHLQPIWDRLTGGGYLDHARERGSVGNGTPFDRKGTGDKEENPFRDAAGKLVIPERASSHSDPALSDFEGKMRRVADDRTAADQKYDALPDSHGGKVIGTDIYRNLLDEYAKDREGKLQFTNATGRVAQAAAKDRLWREIENRGDRKTLLFTAGGVAAGKTTSISKEVRANADLIFDGTLRETAWAQKTIEQAVRKGWKVEVSYVQRPLAEAARGVIERTDQEGRWGSYASLPKTHAEAQHSIVELSKHFAENPQVDFDYVLNHPDGLKDLSLADIDRGGKYSYATNDEKNASTGIRGSDSSADQAGAGGEEAGAYSQEQHTAIFGEAVESGSYDPRALRLLAKGNPELEAIAGKVLPTDVWPGAAAKAAADIQSEGFKLRNRLSDEGGYVSMPLYSDLVDFGRSILQNGMEFGTWAKQMFTHLGERIAHFLEPIWKSLSGGNYLPHARERGSVEVGTALDRARAEKPMPSLEEAELAAATGPEEKRRFVESVRAAQGVQPSVKERLADTVYNVFSDKAAVEAAGARINEIGLERALTEVLTTDPKRNPATKLTNVMGLDLINRLQGQCRFDEAAQVAQHLAETATSQAQALQAMHLVSRLSPEGIQYHAARQIQAALADAPEHVKTTAATLGELQKQAAQVRQGNATSAILSIADMLKAQGLDPERLTALQQRLREIVLQSVAEPGIAKSRLIGMLMGPGGMKEADATRAATKALAEFAKRSAAARDAFLKNLLKVNAPKQQIPKSLIERWMALNKTGVMDDAKLFAEIAKKMGIPVLTPELAAKIKALQAEYARQTDPELKLVAGARMLETVNGIAPSDIWTRIKSIQNFAMLINPKTAFRIIGGNVGMAMLNTVADGVNALVVDPAVSIVTGKRTITSSGFVDRVKGLPQPVIDFRKGMESAQLQGASLRGQLVEGVRTMLTLAQLTAGRKFDLKDVNHQFRYVFSSPAMRLLEDATSFLHSVPDRAFNQAAFDASINRQMGAAKANGNEMLAPTPEMIAEARMDANKATFRDPNFLSEGLAGFRKELNKISTLGLTDKYGMGSVILPFNQVPASILMRGIEWSPVGFIRASYELLRPVLPRGGEFNQKAFVDAFTRATLGTGMIALGAYLYRLGIVTAAPEENRDIEAMRKAAGLGGYRINLDELKRRMVTGNWTAQGLGPQNGDSIVSYGWLEPAAMPLAAGADYAHTMERQAREITHGKIEMSTIASALMAGAKSLEDKPLLSGLAKFSRDIGEHGMLEGLGRQAMAAPGVFVPTVLREATALTDNTIRETGGGTLAQQELNRILVQLPYVSKRFPAKYDAFGQAVERYQAGTNSAFAVLCDPAFVTQVNQSPIGREVERVFAATGKAELPKAEKNTTIVNGQEMQLTNEDITNYRYFTGRFATEMFSRLTASPQFAAMPPEFKAQIMSRQLQAGAMSAKMALFGQVFNEEAASIMRQQDYNTQEAMKAVIPRVQATMQQARQPYMRPQTN